ncbi:methylated-DNA--[protein]-cysteine S-methyltransferase [Candidatus Pandoraea novymonadis]|uniref:Methylated-DNA--protein-cysteine methyltransferase n=1 Tax=Candidatus Pandoraea novymonadis TaxID=1808959 RepID=A0ABX5FEM7_9BURK|nr:methylated-DNA--[protein]-cysteine S-methyltransferase [Candidatus Pandoraea novymonadis]PSB92164.1 Methylated-DNA--protein-cysteine methyltransferase [Candidatus Pandoraea novymonadis]
MIYQTCYNSPLGNILLLSNGNALSGLYFEGQKYFPKISSEWKNGQGLAILQKTNKQLNEFFHDGRRIFSIRLLNHGSPFQQVVWEKLCTIPYGQTTTYSAIALTIGGVNYTRAVGNAIRLNPISVIIPCHRVLGINGTLTGYAAGLSRKYDLLHLETRQSMAV